jgi:FtsZ-interacting cell division protein ZipA
MTGENDMVMAISVIVIVGLIAMVGLFIVVLISNANKKKQAIGGRKHFSSKPPSYNYPTDETDITEEPTTSDIFKSGKYSPRERRDEYRRRGKSPSGVIDGVYNDSFRENGKPYSDSNRDWDSDA